MGWGQKVIKLNLSQLEPLIYITYWFSPGVKRETRTSLWKSWSWTMEKLSWELFTRIANYQSHGNKGKDPGKCYWRLICCMPPWLMSKKRRHIKEKGKGGGIIWSDLSTQTLRQGIELLIYNSRRLSGHTASWSNRSLFCDDRNCIRMTVSVYSFWTTIMMLWWRDRKHWWLVTRKQIQVTSPDGDSGHLNTNLMDLQHDISTMFGSTSEYWPNLPTW